MFNFTSLAGSCSNCILPDLLVGGMCVNPVVCGDSILSSPEECDDGNIENLDGCSSACLNETGYDCSTVGSACTTICGDGLLRGGEECDDGSVDDIGCL